MHVPQTSWTCLRKSVPCGTTPKLVLMTENELATTAVDICYKLHTTLGPGLLESVYEAAFIYELELRGIPYTRQEAIPAIYANVILDVGFRADIVMDEKLLIEIKSVAHRSRHPTKIKRQWISGLPVINTPCRAEPKQHRTQSK